MRSKPRLSKRKNKSKSSGPMVCIQNVEMAALGCAVGRCFFFGHATYVTQVMEAFGTKQFDYIICDTACVIIALIVGYLVASFGLFFVNLLP